MGSHYRVIWFNIRAIDPLLPPDVLRAQGQGCGPGTRAGPGEAGPGAVCGDTARMGGQLPGIRRREEGLASTETRRPVCGPLCGGAVDEAA